MMVSRSDRSAGGDTYREVWLSRGAWQPVATQPEESGRLVSQGRPAVDSEEVSPPECSDGDEQARRAGGPAGGPAVDQQSGRKPGRERDVADAGWQVIGGAGVPRVRLLEVSVAAPGGADEMVRWRFGVAGHTSSDCAGGSLADGEIVEVDLPNLVATMGHNLCALATRDSRRLHVLMRKEVIGAAPFLAPLLQPRCVALGYCDVAANADGRCRVRPFLPPAALAADRMLALSPAHAARGAPGHDVGTLSLSAVARKTES